MKDSFSLYLRLLHYVRPYWRRFAVGMVLIAMTSAMETLLPILLKPLLDGKFTHGTGYPWMIGAGLVGLVIFRGFSAYGADYFMNWIANQIVLNLRRVMFEKILHFPAERMDAQHSSFMINKVMNDVGQVMGACTTVLTSLIRDSITLIGLLLWLFWLNWTLTAVFIIVVPLAAWVIRQFNRLMRRFSLRSMEINGELLQILQETVEGYRTVKIFGGQHYERQRFDHAQRTWKRQQMRLSNSQGAMMPITQIIASFAIAMVIVVATQQTAVGELTVGAMVSYLTAAMMLMPAMRSIAGVSNALQRGLASAESVFALIDMPIEQMPQNTQPLTQPLSGAIHIDRLTFAYPHRPDPILRDINLHIQAGESVALVGASGAGKTSIVSLLSGFFHGYQGNIYFDKRELRTINLADLRANVALVSQEVRLFDDTVRANIAYGELANKSEEAIIEAANAAYAMEFIAQLPQGLDTHIGERGMRLSGGQRQRLAIARAILKNAPILILDEATSALDNESEHKVQSAIDNLLWTRTTLIIAHRLSTIRRVSRIIVLHQGAIVEEGNHESLLAREGYYAKFCQIQASDA